jgi:hypothetical protein
VALCWFPFAHRRTFVARLGLDAHNPHFLKRHRERLVRLLRVSPRNRGSARAARKPPWVAERGSYVVEQQSLATGSRQQFGTCVRRRGEVVADLR